MMTPDAILTAMIPQTGAFITIGAGTIVAMTAFLALALVMVLGAAGELRAARRTDGTIPTPKPQGFTARRLAA